MENINGKTKVCGLIGNPVAHSISPLIHNTISGMIGNDMAYVTFKVENDKVDDAVKGALALDILGLNVTVPHKQAVINTLADIDPLAKAIGAVNTLVRCENGYKGYNTDIYGLDRELTDEGINLENKKVVILGAGGAARAIAFLCAKRNACKVFIVNRTLDKARNIADAVNEYFKVDIADVYGLDAFVQSDIQDYIVIQTTSVGLHPNDEDVVISDESFYQKAIVGVDIIYNPSQTKFMKLMKANGKYAYNGLKMLLYQGVAAYELWNDCVVENDVIECVYKKMQEALGIDE